jgi:glycosyltransferase involved in cell wall biosynthesis
VNIRRVLHVCQPVDGGVPVVVQQLLDGQANRGMEVSLACPPSAFAEDAASRHLHLPWSASRSPGPRVWQEVRTLRQMVAKVDPQVVHLHSSKAGLAGRLAIRGRLATVFQPHAWSFLAVDGAERTLALQWERFAARWADVTVCVSHAERNEGLRSGVHPSRLRIVPNAVDVKQFVPRDRSAARLRLGLDPAERIAVCVGRLAAQKGIDLLLTCWRSVLSQVPQAKLVIVGDGPDAPVLLDQAHGLPGVSFTGARHDIVDWYAAADVVVLPSRWEGMALVPLEAMACERSVVGFDVEGVSECLGSSDPPALVPPEDVAALAAALVLRLTSRELCAQEGRQHLDRARTIPGWDQVVDLTTQIYAEAVALKHRGE